MYVTSSDLPVRNSPDANAEKILTLKKDDEVKVLEIEKDWYKIEYTTYSGWVKKDCLTKNNPNQEQTANNNTYTASQLRSKLSFDMALNTPSGASLEQFEKLFENDSQDKNNVFKDNAKYFYYAEQQYNINGIFLASIGIHESAWGTSKNINELNDADICYGKMIVTVGSNRDECEFYFNLDKVAQKLGCDVSDFKQISAQFGRLGQEWINTAGASSGAWLGLFICIAGTCGVVVYKKKKGSIQV